MLLSPQLHHTSPLLPTLADITAILPSTRTTPCYVIASDGKQTAVFEKDLATADIRSSTSFIAQTNHDISCEGDPLHTSHQSKMVDMIGMEDIIEESTERKECVERNWMEARKIRVNENWTTADHVAVELKEVQRWMGQYPIANECTHFACVMDPMNGQITWVRRWRKPLKN
jgi:hypothetical protein